MTLKVRPKQARLGAPSLVDPFCDRQGFVSWATVVPDAQGWKACTVPHIRSGSRACFCNNCAIAKRHAKTDWASTGCATFGRTFISPASDGCAPLGCEQH